MSETLREQIRNSLELKDIYELLEIWKTNNRIEWSETTFVVLHEILKEKLREIPPQDAPILAENEFEENDDQNTGLEEWEEKIIDSENRPELYNSLQVISLRRTIDRLAIVVIVVYILQAVLNSQLIQMLLQGVSISINDIENIIRNMLIISLNAALKIILTYFPLKALSHILRILMEMEFTSRKR
ncbi:MAG: hypothetical protein J0L96_21745 [Anaerolineae bacterium]|nr:hypothetical protein [Anaerolineae bacterium]